MFGFGKGKIEIQLQKYNYAPGEIVQGTVTLKLKKPLEAKELNIRILGEKKIRQRYGQSTTYRSVPVFDFKQPLDGAKAYGDQPMTYQFKIKIPTDVKQGEPDGALGKTLKVVQMMSGTTSRITWRLIARLEVKGFDVTKKVQINVA